MNVVLLAEALRSFVLTSYIYQCNAQVLVDLEKTSPSHVFC